MVVHCCAANQEPAYLLTKLLTLTTTQKFPSLFEGGGGGLGLHVLTALLLGGGLLPLVLAVLRLVLHVVLAGLGLVPVRVVVERQTDVLPALINSALGVALKIDSSGQVI